MEFFNISYNDKDVMAEVYAISGPPYRFFDRLKKGGTGTPRGILEDAPDSITQKFNHLRSLRYCTLQEMQNGILLCFNCRQETFAVPMNRRDIVDMGWTGPLDDPIAVGSFEINTRDGDCYKIKYNKGYKAAIDKFLDKMNMQNR